jgi:single-strand selective monofunctional uracil DNA glycosylase
MAGSTARALVDASRELARDLERRRFHAPVRYVYNPLAYARDPWERYLAKYAQSRKRVVFVGMNPGPWGMAQTGVPFGEVMTVREWLEIDGRVDRPHREHPRLAVAGFGCHRREVSGMRLWGLMRERFGTAERFFGEHFVANYCPLLFLDEQGRNLTPDRIALADRGPLYRSCDRHLAAVIEVLDPEWAIGIGRFAEGRVREVALARRWERLRTAGLPHPSPASPQANRGWAATADRILRDLGVW